MSDKPLTMHPFESAIVRTLEADNARLTAENEKLRAALERMLLEFDFMVEREIIPDVRNDVIFVEAHAALSGDKP